MACQLFKGLSGTIPLEQHIAINGRNGHELECFQELLKTCSKGLFTPSVSANTIMEFVTALTEINGNKKGFLHKHKRHTTHYISWGSTYPGWGYLSWMEDTYLGQGVPTLAGWYLIQGRYAPARVPPSQGRYSIPYKLKGK